MDQDHRVGSGVIHTEFAGNHCRVGLGDKHERSRVLLKGPRVCGAAEIILHVDLPSSIGIGHRVGEIALVLGMVDDEYARVG